VSDPLVTQLAGTVAGAVVGQASLAGHTTLRVGGPARVLVVAENDDDLAAVGRAAQDHRVGWAVVGRGSNLLVADAGWPGIAVLLGRGFRGITIDGRRVRAGAAEPLPTLAVQVADAGLTGFAWACAVPGAVGGAVRMNAGAHGGDMAAALVEVEIFRLGLGVREVWPAAALGLAYRHSEIPDDGVVVAATLDLPAADPDVVNAEIASIRTWRREHQPLNEPNCGSVFANPPGDSAGRLVDAAGAKGLRVGGAMVSDRHANFVVTRPGATAADVLGLIGRVQDLVEASSGVRLRPEVVVRGAFEPAGPS
jgi:UDP-N-acetylmuramate dehydrogenase